MPRASSARARRRPTAGTPARSARRVCRRRCGKPSRTRTGRSSAATAAVCGTSTSSIGRSAAAARRRRFRASDRGRRGARAQETRPPVHRDQNDGDLMYAPGALWTAAHHRIPMLLVMHNNRAYHQEVMHIQRMANRHQRGITNAGIGTTITDPNIDYATLARSMGVYAEGPITDPEGSWSGAEARRRARRARRAGAGRRGHATALEERSCACQS